MVVETNRVYDATVSLFRSSEDRKAKRAGVDESRIPPGQYYTDKWPVLHAGSVPRVDAGAWDFRAFGLVRNPIRLSLDELIALGTQEQTSDIHCVTRWRSEEHTSELQSRQYLVCRLLLEKKKKNITT